MAIPGICVVNVLENSLGSRAEHILAQFGDSLTGKILPDSPVKLVKGAENVTQEPGVHGPASVVDSSSCEGDRRMFGHALGSVSCEYRDGRWVAANAR